MWVRGVGVLTNFTHAQNVSNLPIKIVCTVQTSTLSMLVCDGEGMRFGARSISLHASRGGAEHPRSSAEEGKVHPE